MAQLFTAGLFLFSDWLLAFMETEKGLLYKKSAERFNNLITSEWNKAGLYAEILDEYRFSLVQKKEKNQSFPYKRMIIFMIICLMHFKIYFELKIHLHIIT
ncbi:hypothetical protein [Bacillus subtilis]|uniref:hypothetical protein n=1 Tax=Bacillus subtilis TaxID=1423 RepID=UPI0002C4EDFF|nr:hypothetical protein [Bacillus subtilis]AKD34076.1 hypothetical protein AW03_006760 [Bacillus subtilis HJ5]ALS83143.1 hypothetical protein AT706_14870 [Bacillus subtilis subsp. subtilis]AGI27943.1 hypothetical protein I653_03405 [Bacillus subtilis subsp. subtilis str. BAB-1]ASK22679.1 hypothetical protein BSSX_0762 [Bacillus subtilis]QGU25592.1 hypothetical protein GFX43_017820 [Bacillus subtilis]